MYLSLLIITELMMLAMFLHVLTCSGVEKAQKKWYLFTFASIMFCSGTDYVLHCGLYVPAMALPLTVLTVIQFSLTPLLGVFFSGGLGLKNRERYAIIFLIVNLLIESFASPFDLMFYFDETGYHRGRFFLIYTALYLISLIYLVVSLIIAGKKHGYRDLPTVIMIPVIVAAGVVPMILEEIRIAYLAVGISACICYIYYNDIVQKATQTNLTVNQAKIQRMEEQMIAGLATLIENRDMETGEHISRTRLYVRYLAEAARREGVYKDEITDRFISLLYTLAPMHDIGKVLIPDRILNKPEKLTDEEFEQMKEHAAVGSRLIREILLDMADDESLSMASDIATYHHERWDGTGYPYCLKGEEIPLCARIMAIADVFDALISERCYKKAIPVEEAFKIIEKGKGTHFDPRLTDVFMKYRDEFVNLK